MKGSLNAPSMTCIQTKIFFCWARKGLGTSLALQCYAGFVSSAFPRKSRKIEEMKRGRGQRKTVHYFRSFIYSLPAQQDCVLPVIVSKKGVGESCLWWATSAERALSSDSRPRAFYLTIRPVALEGEGSNCFSTTQQVGQKSSNKGSKCKLKKYLFWGKKPKKNQRILLLDDYYY